MTKKILRIITRLNIGGPAIHVTNLNYYLDKEYDYNSVLVHGSLSMSEGSMEYLVQEKGLKTYLIPELGREISPLSDLKIIWKLFWLIRKERPDIVHTHTAKAGLVGRLAARLAGVKNIYHTFHGHVFHDYFSNFKTKIFILIERFLAGMTTKIIAISVKQKEELLTYKIALLNKIVIIPLGFELNKLKENNHKRYIRQLLNVDDNIKIIGIIGRLVPIKNHHYFLEIAQQVCTKINDVLFLIIGDGELRPEIEQEIKKRNLTGKVVITGFINGLAKVYDDLDIIVLTSRNEGTPVTLIEALAFAKPVISTNVGGVADVLGNGSYGCLEEQSQSDKYAADLISMITNYEQALAKARQGQELIMKKYDISRLVKDVHALYQT